MLLYHGNPDPDFKPFYGGGKEYHDYGKGLYCVEDAEAAKEWACQYIGIETSFVYTYEIDDSALIPVLDLNKYAPIYWISAFDIPGNMLDEIIADPNVIGDLAL